MFFANLNPEVLIIGGAAIFSIMVIFVVIFIVLYQRRYYAYRRHTEELQNNFQKELLRTQLETQEDTFYKVGEEIHDNIGQLLSSTKILLSVTERGMISIPSTFKTAQETLSTAIKEIRYFAKSLNKEWLHQFNLIQNLETEVDRINLAQTTDVTLQTDVVTLPLPADSQVMLFRIVQESINNAIRHGNAQLILISVVLGNSIKIVINDNGVGFDVTDTLKNGVGLLNMKHRANLLGGSIEWDSAPARGTKVIIEIPI